MNIIFGNYGDSTIALIQWANEQAIPEVTVVNVNTGWGATTWVSRVTEGKALAKAYGFEVVTLNAPKTMAELVRDRGEFPSVQFQWCPGLLKGLPFLLWLDEIDPHCEATIHLGRSLASQPDLPLEGEYEEDSEHYGERRVRYPFYQFQQTELMALIHKTPIAPLMERSGECDPCIHSDGEELSRLNDHGLAQVKHLESTVHKPMFNPAAFGESQGIHQVAHYCTKMLNQATISHPQQRTTFDMGCGSPYGCGDLITHQKNHREPSGD